MRGGRAMAILKQLLDLAAHEPAREPSADKTERERVFHSVFEDTGCGTVRLKRMSVFPAGEWAGDLDIAEVAILFEVPMFRNPAQAKRPSSKPQHDAPAALDSARSLDNFHVFARRREPFQCIRQSVPGVYLGCGSLNSGAVDKDFSLHFASLRGNPWACRAGQETRAKDARNL